MNPQLRTVESAARHQGELSSRYAPLRPGRQPSSLVERYQRERLVAAAADVVHEHGAVGLSATLIIGKARISRPTFYEHFENKGDCLEYACAYAGRYLFDPLKAAARDGRAPWLKRVSSALECFLEAAACEPLLAELYLIYSWAPPSEGRMPGWQTGIEAMMEMMRGAREAGREAAGNDYVGPLPGIEEFIACAIFTMVTTRVKQGEAESLPKLREELVRLVAAPFGINADRQRDARTPGAAEVAGAGARD